MFFYEVLPALMKGAKIKRKGSEVYWETDQNNIYPFPIEMGKAASFACDLDGKDILARDWEVIEERIFMSFQQAMQHFFEGKKIRRKAWKGSLCISKDHGQTGYSPDIDRFCQSLDPGGIDILSHHDMKADDWYVVEET